MSTMFNLTAKAALLVAIVSASWKSIGPGILCILAWFIPLLLAIHYSWGSEANKSREE